MGFGKSKAKLLTERHGRVTFDDVAGVDEAKEELQEIVEFLHDPQKFQRLGGRIPRGVLLVGPPGTGKTLLARAIAGEANVPFFTISGSDFVEMFVGVGASRVRDMFEQAKKNAPCIIFIDEIDAVGRHRGAGLGGGNDEREQTLNQLLVEMDGFEANEGIILIAATNRPDVLDPALLRPGRFDRQVVVPRPDVIGREKILKVHMRKVPLAPDVDLRVIARGTPGFSGADLANLVNEAALLAARRGKRLVTQLEFEDAKDKVMMGAERRSMVMTEEEKTLTAYHEGGHALVALHMPASDPVHKATIIPRGRALGMVMRLPERDMLSYTRAKLKADITVAMGGRVAEELVFGYDKVTIRRRRPTSRWRRCWRAPWSPQYGMSDKLGPLRLRRQRGRGVPRPLHRADAEPVRRDPDQSSTRRSTASSTRGSRRARKILSENLDDLHTIARGLLEYETLSGEEIKDLLKGKPPVREFAAEVHAAAGTGLRRADRRTRQAAAEPEPDTGGLEPAAADLRRGCAHRHSAMPGLAPGIFVFGRAVCFVLRLAHGARSSIVRPIGLLYGAAAEAAVAAGLALPLAGGPIAFAAVELIEGVPRQRPSAASLAAHGSGRRRGDADLAALLERVTAQAAALRRDSRSTARC